MKKNFLFFILLLAASAAISQATQKEVEEMLKSLQKKRDSVLNDPRIKKYINGTNGLTANQPTGNKTTYQLPADQNEKKFEKIKLPPKDSAKIRIIPSKNFSLPELHSYLENLYTQLTKKFPSDAVNSAAAIAAKLNDVPSKLEATALEAWQNGAMEEAVLLITKGAVLCNDDGLLLANAGGLLDMYGMSEKAIPVLRTVVQYAPQNAIALNNLGQAFTALGMQDSALNYFAQCLKISPQHPEANNTAGLIELGKGNKQKAQAYFENSIRGGFNQTAYSGLRSILKEKCRIADLIKPKVKLPEYFNQFRYKLPHQCMNVQEAATVKEEQKEFREATSNAIRLYQKLEKETEKNFAATNPMQFNQNIYDKISRGESYLRPFQIMAGIIEAETIIDYQKDLTDLQVFNTNNRKQYKDLEQQYKNDYDALLKKFDDDDEECCGEGNVSCCNSNFCKEANDLKNKYLPQFAQVNEEWQKRNLLTELKYFDDLIFWSYFSAVNPDDYRVRFYQKVLNYLTALLQFSQVKILEPCVAAPAEETEKPGQKDLKEFDCPFDIEFPFIVGKVILSCEKFSFKAGEGIVFKYEKKFTGKRQSTITIGAGDGIDASWKLAGVKGGFEVGASMSVFLTFDQAGNCTDGGMMYSASRGMGLDFSAGEKIKIKKDLAYVGEEMSWRFGINSGAGFTMPDTPFKEKKEQPINKNVKIYKPSNG